MAEEIASARGEATGNVEIAQSAMARRRATLNEEPKLLIVVEESRATTKALQYVAQMVAGRRHFRVCLAHSLLSPPRQLVEYRGAEKGRLRAYKSRWIFAGDMTEQRALDRANAVLRQGGLARGAIEAHYCCLVDGSRATQEILKLARMRKCDTVVIGRASLSWLGNLIRGDAAEEFVRQGKGFTIWAVE
jgi:nucleotide-binding universal stress UspA family protein